MDSAIIDATAFPAKPESTWRSLAEKALKGADFDAVLVSHTEEGIAYGPLHARRKNPGLLPRNNPSQPWRIVQRVDDPVTARAIAQIEEEAAGGATGLSLVFEGAPTAYGFGLKPDADTLSSVMAAVPLNRMHVRIDAHPRSRSSAEWMLAALQKRRVDPQALSINFGIDPAAIFGGTGYLRMTIESMKASMPQSLSGFFALNVPGVLLEADGRPYHNAGATISQELGAMLATAISHLKMFEEARQPLVYAVPLIGFALSVDQDLFQSIAKIRALRRLWAQAQAVCGIDPQQSPVHAETSMRMMAKLDPETNILRSTIAAFAAGAGGADTICVLPHTIAHGLPDPFARRVARNTQLILIDETHLDHVADPAAGSGGIRHLTEAFCEAAWTEFQRIEAEGGIFDSLLKGAFQARVAKAHEERTAAVKSGARHIVGTTLYPAKEERPVTVLENRRAAVAEVGVERCEPMPLRPFEAEIGEAA